MIYLCALPVPSTRLNIGFNHPRYHIGKRESRRDVSEPTCFEQLVNSVMFEFRLCSNTGTLERRRTNNSTIILLPPPFIHSPKSDICRWFLIARLRCPGYSSCPSPFHGPWKVSWK
ncbi:hypothetical protein ARMGADRAFT_96281 [Armillaria gallica]|uniref:C3H1-type domain-containing protein n=1 Tax=Armillaria gallica TaxID=47427 RepID=A0A2H3CXJ9_ARMGA|nr:hypothetical protein ARMGADRAFT_96281 [Armillaria gallica]